MAFHVLGFRCMDGEVAGIKPSWQRESLDLNMLDLRVKTT